MKERPIIFSAEMVRAIISGRKTQTRRVVKPQTQFWSEWYPCVPSDPSEYKAKCYNSEQHFRKGIALDFSYGQPGDLLWVRETWRPWPHPEMWDGIMYKADEAFVKPLNLSDHEGFWLSGQCEKIDLRWRSPRFMPRWASRITLEITDVRVQRVQEISEEDAVAEGIADAAYHPNSFAELWDTINAKHGYSWESNPWVWAISFDVKEIKR